MKVEVRGSDSKALDRALKEFKQKVKRSGILDDLKRYEHYNKPSLRKKLKKQEALKRRRREQNAKRRKSERDSS